MAEICVRLCHGLAKNIVDTAFEGQKPNGPVIFTDGVSQNRAVVRHLEDMIGLKVIVEKTLYGATGATLLASDRCTVFMERDLKHYLSEGYAVNEVLASVLHAIRENYLTKVAIENNIGKTILFQGATAKNKALVAAFEQRLQKPIHVSRYCHLTSALGTAILLSEQKISTTNFRSLGLHEKKIPIQSEVFELCTNHCKLTLADIEGERIAYGFLCGRDYGTAKYVSNNICGFDLLKERKRQYHLSCNRNPEPASPSVFRPHPPV